MRSHSVTSSASFHAGAACPVGNHPKSHGKHREHEKPEPENRSGLQHKAECSYAPVDQTSPVKGSQYARAKAYDPRQHPCRQYKSQRVPEPSCYHLAHRYAVCDRITQIAVKRIVRPFNKPLHRRVLEPPVFGRLFSGFLRHGGFGPHISCQGIHGRCRHQYERYYTHAHH